MASTHPETEVQKSGTRQPQVISHDISKADEHDWCNARVYSSTEQMITCFPRRDCVATAGKYFLAKQEETYHTSIGRQCVSHGCTEESRECLIFSLEPTRTAEKSLDVLVKQKRKYLPLWGLVLECQECSGWNKILLEHKIQPCSFPSSESWWVLNFLPYWACLAFSCRK